jgi:hypothetical protein
VKSVAGHLHVAAGPTGPAFKARGNGWPDSEMTVDQYWALREPDLSETSLLMDGGWTRPNRFISDGSDIAFEKALPPSE